ncbi:MAG: IS1 family transposase [Prevotellaceae bacterium]|nr:IS1 family transposase [Prevotellaceae bacterium]
MQRLYWLSTIKKRTDDIFLKLFCFLSLIPISMYFTNDWGAYTRHYTGKDTAWKIERKNLNFRMHIKRLNTKTICYFRNEQIHDYMIGILYRRDYFKSGIFLDTA